MGMGLLSYKVLSKSEIEEKVPKEAQLQGNPNGPLAQPNESQKAARYNGNVKFVKGDQSLRRFTPKREYHRYWTDATKPHHLQTEAFKEMSFRRIFSW